MICEMQQTIQIREFTCLFSAGIVLMAG